MIIQYSTGKAELCFVKVPEEATDFETGSHQQYFQLFFSAPFNGMENARHLRPLPPGNWQIVGNPFELSEQESRCIVQEIDHPYDYQYIDYEYPGKLYLTAKRSMQSLLGHLKIYQTNPFAGIFAPRLVNASDLNDIGSVLIDAIYHDLRDRWKEAEERTGSFVLLKKIAP